MNPPKDIVLGDRAIPFRAVKKIVNFSPESGAVLQRITWLNQGKLAYLYGNFVIPNLTLKVGDACRKIKLDEIKDVIPASIPSGPAAVCPD